MEYLLLYFWLVGVATATVWFTGLGRFDQATSVRLGKPGSAGVRQAYAGFSKSYLIFGWLVPIARGEVLTGLFHLLCTAVSLGVFQGITSFVYNQQHRDRLIARGWQVDPESEGNLVSTHPESGAGEAESVNQPYDNNLPPDMPVIGQIQLFAFNFMPIGWTLCDGRLRPIQEHMVVFALLGNVYGGDGVSTFAVPNLVGKEPLPGTVYGVCTGTGNFPSRPLA